jgi:hypothetical protein
VDRVLVFGGQNEPSLRRQEPPQPEPL